MTLGCVYRDSSARVYAGAGCEVLGTAEEEGAVTAVTCGCSHLTLFAVAQLAPAQARPTTAATPPPPPESNSSESSQDQPGTSAAAS